MLLFRIRPLLLLFRMRPLLLLFRIRPLLLLHVLLEIFSFSSAAAIYEPIALIVTSSRNGPLFSHSHDTSHQSLVSYRPCVKPFQMIVTMWTQVLLLMLWKDTIQNVRQKRNGWEGTCNLSDRSNWTHLRRPRWVEVEGCACRAWTPGDLPRLEVVLLGGTGTPFSSSRLWPPPVALSPVGNWCYYYLIWSRLIGYICWSMPSWISAHDSKVSWSYYAVR